MEIEEVKRKNVKKPSLGRSVSTHFVADCGFFLLDRGQLQTRLSWLCKQKTICLNGVYSLSLMVPTSVSTSVFYFCNLQMMTKENAYCFFRFVSFCHTLDPYMSNR